MATSDPAGGWWPRHDTSFLATLCRHKTNKRNPIIEKEANEQHVIALSHIPYQPDYIMKIIVLLSVLPIATAVGPFVPFPYEPFGIYKQRQWVGLCAEISCGLTYRWKCDIVVVEDTRISLVYHGVKSMFCSHRSIATVLILVIYLLSTSHQIEESNITNVVSFI